MTHPFNIHLAFGAWETENDEPKYYLDWEWELRLSQHMTFLTGWLYTCPPVVIYLSTKPWWEDRVSNMALITKKVVFVLHNSFYVGSRTGARLAGFYGCGASHFPSRILRFLISRVEKIFLLWKAHFLHSFIHRRWYFLRDVLLYVVAL